MNTDMTGIPFTSRGVEMSRVAEKNGEYKRSQLRILMLEDSCVDIELNEFEISEAGLDFVTMRAVSENDFLEGLLGFQPNIILSDYELPDYDGISALTLVREKCPDIPFIFVTGRMGEETAIEMMTRGATDYVLKHRLSRLAPAIKRALKEVEDKTNRRIAEEALRESEERYRTIVKAANEGICVIGEENKIVFANDRLSEMLGYSVEELTGKSIFEFLDEEGAAAATVGWWRGYKDFRERVEARLTSRDGSALWTIVSTTPLRDKDGKYTGTLVMLTDISKRKKAEELIKKNSEELKNLIEIAAHELRHPATVFRGYAQILMEDWEDLDRETIQNALSRIDAATTRLMRLVISLLETSRIERGKIDLSLSEVDPVAPVMRVVEEFRLREVDRELRLTCEVLGKEEMDAEKVKQVLVILIDNAAKYSDKKCPIDIECVKVEGEIVYRIADLGPGISDEDKERIFERFYQVEDVLHHSVPGIGLGLYIAKVIVEVQGGWISEEPRDGGGSVFSFGIPCRP